MDRREVRAKKHLGQHFLKELKYSREIAEALELSAGKRVLEIGPGTAALTQFLFGNDLKVVEIDTESVDYLKGNYPKLSGRILEVDFLKLDLNTVFEGQEFSLCGNFPYNISSQILFHALDHRNLVVEVCGMFQKEVAKRIASPHGSKEYGILSVLMQAYYDVEYLFDVPPSAFTPPPKVISGVLRARRKEGEELLSIPQKKLSTLVKLAFNQRRKTLRNALSSLGIKDLLDEMQLSGLRAEQVPVATFIDLAKKLENKV